MHTQYLLCAARDYYFRALHPRRKDGLFANRDYSDLERSTVAVLVASKVDIRAGQGARIWWRAG